MRPIALASALAAAAFASPSLVAGVPVTVTFTGSVEFNQIAAFPLSTVAAGAAVELSFELDSSDFVDSASFPTRGFVIDPSTWMLKFNGNNVALQSPFPGTPYFVIRNNDPAVDGFFVSTDVDFPLGVPLTYSGSFGHFLDNTSVTYGGDAVPSLDLLDALGTYDYTGLQVFHWTLDDGPFDAMGMIFEQIDIALAPSAWTDEGSALAGVDGEPRLVGAGDLSAGGTSGVFLDHGAPSALAAIFLAAGTMPLPFKGGMLLPGPFLPPVLVATTPDGAIDVPFVVPAGLPSGGELWVQWAIQDAAAPAGVSLSNAVSGLIP
ncbi:MAG: hypothetical protein H6825_07075 [Planctomycetes bacterium]|nr:hypothetical protein [Planctomycetota bacterium]